MKKQAIMAFLIMVSMLITSFHSVKASNIVEQGTYGSTISWTLDDEGTLTVKGNEVLTKEFSESITDRVEGKVVHFNVEEGITGIDEFMYNNFWGCQKLTIAGSVKRIERVAFSFS